MFSYWANMMCHLKLSNIYFGYPDIRNNFFLLLIICSIWFSSTSASDTAPVPAETTEHMRGQPVEHIAHAFETGWPCTQNTARTNNNISWASDHSANTPHDSRWKYQRCFEQESEFLSYLPMTAPAQPTTLTKLHSPSIPSIWARAVTFCLPTSSLYFWSFSWGKQWVKWTILFIKHNRIQFAGHAICDFDLRS